MMRQADVLSILQNPGQLLEEVRHEGDQNMSERDGPLMAAVRAVGGGR